MQVDVGPVHLGDEELSRDLFRRIALNFGTAIRVYTPVDPHAPQAINCVVWLCPSDAERTPPLHLQGDGLRPNENRDQAAANESAIPGQESPPGSDAAGNLQGLMQGGVDSEVRIFLVCRTPCPPNPYIPFTMPSNDQ